jgi:hypothetical protein
MKGRNEMVKKEKKIIFAIQPDLFEIFRKKCEKQYKTISEVLRDYIIHYIGENGNASKKNNK